MSYSIQHCLCGGTVEKVKNLEFYKCKVLLTMDDFGICNSFSS